MENAVSDQFDTVSFADLVLAGERESDNFSFGVIGFGSDYLVCRYNAVESIGSGLRAAHVIGKHVFDEVAICMNNFMIAQRFLDESELDEIVPYILTLRMKPTPVRLRLMKSSRAETQFLLIERRAAT
ncbi:phosphonate transporter (plasmid) [Burkholderia sp. PAMC 26561]|nr:phosphonate transporter [Burkholderia sp. PAMC 26561]AME28045.1 phosphonate transporter [Burkholderia sp. PAMC 26561]